METIYCPRPPPSPPPTPPLDPSDVDPTDLLLNDESDALWSSALHVARSVTQVNIGAHPSNAKIEPDHLALALLYDGIQTIDHVVQLDSDWEPLLDVPLFWTVITKAGGNPHDIGRDIRRRCLNRERKPHLNGEEEPSNDINRILLKNSSAATKQVLSSARRSLSRMNDSFVAPHHIILALLQDQHMSELFTDHGLVVAVLAEVTERLRPRRVRTQQTKPRFFVLQQFASDLTEEARQDLIGPIIGRDEELRRLTVILSRRRKCNAVLLGEPGVGKTAVAEGLALRIVNRDVPRELNCRIFSLDMGTLLASTTCHGKLELRVKAILEEIQENESEGVPVILYIDDMHLITTGRKTGGAGGMDVSNLMKPLLARGKIRCFGATTFHDYKHSIETDQSLARRFSPIVVCEPKMYETITIVRGLKDRIEKFHRLPIMDAAIVDAVCLAARYVTYRCLPDSAIDLIDEACAMLKMHRELNPEGLEILLKRKQALEIAIRCLSSELERTEADSMKRLEDSKSSLSEVKQELQTAEGEYAEERNRRNRIVQLKGTIAELERDRERNLRGAKRMDHKIQRTRRDLEKAEAEYCDHPIYPHRLTSAVVAQVISEQTAIPIQALLAHEKPHYISLEEDLSRVVVGQREATHAIAQAIHLSRSGLSSPSRPVASFLLVGHPGTGKTLIAKELAKLMFKSGDKLLIINGAEYGSDLNLARLIGTPSCSGYDQGGELTECIKRKPFCIVLVDNIDRACSEFILKFRTLIDQGFLEDGDSKKVDFRNCIILLTTTLGAHCIDGPGTLSDSARKNLRAVLEKAFSADFLSCLDSMIPFTPLSLRDLALILKSRIHDLEGILIGKGISLEVDNKAQKHLLVQGMAPIYDARALIRRLRTEVEDRLMPFLNQSSPPHRLRVTEEDGYIRVLRE